MEEDRGFEVVDKRHTSSARESETEKAKAKEQTDAVKEQQAEGETSGPGEMPALDVYSAITWYMNSLAGLAWQWMGLVPNAGSGKIERDMNQARIAIDSVVFLFDKIAPHLSEEERRHMRTTISDLQVNFVKQSGKSE